MSHLIKIYASLQIQLYLKRYGYIVSFSLYFYSKYNTLMVIFFASDSTNEMIKSNDP